MCEIKLEFSCHECGRTKRQPHVHDPYKMVVDYKPPDWEIIGVNGNDSDACQLWCPECFDLFWKPHTEGGFKFIQIVSESDREKDVKSNPKVVTEEGARRCLCFPPFNRANPACPVHNTIEELAGG